MKLWKNLLINLMIIKFKIFETLENENELKIQNFAEQIESELPVQVRLEYISGKEEGFVLKDIEVNKNATGGVAGYQAMMKIFKFADDNNFVVSLVPAGSYRNSKKKLNQWYEGLGFKENKDKNSEHKIMIRKPNN